MKRFFAALLSTLCLFSLAACGDAPSSSTSAPPTGSASFPPESSAKSPATPTDAERVADMVSAMSIEEKVGQLFFARCPETGAVEDVATYHLGGYVLFTRDFKDKTADEVIQRNREYQSSAAIPLLIGVDEEGGTVVRVSSNSNLRASKFKSPQALYKQGNLVAIEEDTKEKDALLASLGINVNLAPVADVSTDPKDFIYERSLGRDNRAVEEYVGITVGVMSADGMGSVLKHFPGYGNNLDTHTGIAVDKRPLTQFQENDFTPFRVGVAAGSGKTAVLVSHNIMASVDDQLPASLSPAVHALLRKELDFSGVIMTDDLVMDAVKSYADNGSAAVLAIQAGNDLLISSDFQADIAAVLAAVEGGTLDKALIDAACQRVLLWKVNLALL